MAGGSRKHKGKHHNPHSQEPDPVIRAAEQHLRGKIRHGEPRVGTSKGMPGTTLALLPVLLIPQAKQEMPQPERAISEAKVVAVLNASRAWLSIVRIWAAVALICVCTLATSVLTALIIWKACTGAPATDLLVYGAIDIPNSLVAVVGLKRSGLLRQRRP